MNCLQAHVPLTVERSMEFYRENTTSPYNMMEFSILQSKIIVQKKNTGK